MMMAKKALVIGKFQPITKGHIDLFKQIKKKGFDTLLIGVGHCGIKNREHPLSFDQVKNMLKTALEDMHGIEYKIYKIPDIPDDKKYASHVKKIIKDIDKNTVLFSSNKRTRDCFTRYKHKLKINAPKHNVNVHPAEVRQKIARGENWLKHMPKKLHKYMRKHLKDIKKHCCK
ncbi:adenylyltransferase/cytidyltransferase family protein [Candidatus Woesearchaeota archaeon]|nr:adenylyltransferase/cytidyltransferase family protein [Candidatus Woesearchaeota archaeon]